jgi:hypothetical protein
VIINHYPSPLPSPTRGEGILGETYLLQQRNYIIKKWKVKGKRLETWTYLYSLILNLLNELLTFVLSSERRGK